MHLARIKRAASDNRSRPFKPTRLTTTTFLIGYFEFRNLIDDVIPVPCQPAAPHHAPYGRLLLGFVQNYVALRKFEL